MSTNDDCQSVSDWIQELQAGDRSAAQHLWSHFSHAVLRLAAKRLAGRRPAVMDEEDVALSVFRTLFRRAEAGGFSQLEDRQDFWRLLITITERKVTKCVRNQRRMKRGSGHIRNESVSSDDTFAGMQNIASKEPTPEFVASMAETVDQLLGMLDEENRTIALARLEGYSNEQIADQIDRSVATVERRIKMIRSRWSSWSEGA